MKSRAVVLISFGVHLITSSQFLIVVFLRLTVLCVHFVIHERGINAVIIDLQQISLFSERCCQTDIIGHFVQTAIQSLCLYLR